MATKTEQTKAATLAGWKKAAVHYPLLPSNTRVGIKIPDLPAIISGGELPNSLLDAAIGVTSKGADDITPTKELIKEQSEFFDHLVKITVVEPQLSDDDLKDIPFEDKEMIVEIATRRRDMDAEGKHLAGLKPIRAWESFREGEYGVEALPDS